MGKLWGGIGINDAVIVAACAVVHLVCFGTMRADGVIFKALLENEPDLTREEISWPFTLFGAAVILASPITGWVSSCFSTRVILFVGALVSSLGCVACFFSTTTVYLSAFYGILRGTGMALATTTIPAFIMSTFVQNRSIAMGLATIGTPVGGFILPTIVQLFINMYGLKGTFLLIGGISLQGAVAAMLLVKRSRTQPAHDNSELRSGKETLHTENTYYTNYTIKRNSKVDVLEPKDGLRSSNKSLALETGIKSDLPDENSSLLKQQTSLVLHVTDCDTETIRALDPAFNTEKKIPTSTDNSKSKVNITEALKIVFTCNGFYLAALTDVSYAALLSIYDLIIVDYAGDKGIEVNLAVHLVTVTSAGELVGRIIFGWITDLKYISYQNFLSFFLLITGVLGLLLSFIGNYSALMSIAVLMGVSLGAVNTASNVVYSEYMAGYPVYLAVSFTKCIVGISFLPRPALIGLFRDTLGSYDHLIQLICSLIFVVSLLWCLEGFCRNRKCKKNIDVKN